MEVSPYMQRAGVAGKASKKMRDLYVGLWVLKGEAKK